MPEPDEPIVEKIFFRHYRVPKESGFLTGLSVTFPLSGKPNDRHLVRYFRRRNGSREWVGVTQNGTVRLLTGGPEPHERGGKTICYITHEDKEGNPLRYAMGEALCSFSDHFCYRTGRIKALGKARSNLQKLTEK
jgi:hypothetical protein